MHISTDIIKDEKELSKEQKEKLAKRIADDFNRWDDARVTQIDMAKKIQAETYLNQTPRKKKQEWQNDVKMNGLYNLKRTKKSTIWSQVWSNPAQMFDVRGTNEQTEKMAKMQKAAIVDSLTKMNIGKQFDYGIDNLFDIGEIIFKVDWEQKKKIVKRQKKNIGFVLQHLMRLATGAGYGLANNFQDIEIPYYENARVQNVSPFLFVFDAAKWEIGNKESWDSVIKISKRFDTIENLKENKFYEITPEMEEELKIENEKSSENQETIDIRDKNEYAGKYSILFAHGDFKINGKLYKNYVAEVLAGKYLIRFEENPIWENPFILCALEYDPLTKRGISCLKSAYDMCLKEEDLTNAAFDAQELTIHPAYWVGKDWIAKADLDKDGNIKIAPNKAIQYDEQFAQGQPIPVNVNANGIDALLSLLDNKIADVTSVSSVMYGNIENSKRTATELSLADKGSGSQIAKELDTINQDLIIPMIEKIAELLAMFKDGADYVYAQEKGKNIEYKIDNTIRQAQYTYFYEDRNAISERKSKFNEIFQIFKEVAQSPDLFSLVDWREVITTAVELVGFDNTEKFFVQNQGLSRLTDMINQVPEGMQEQVIGSLTQQLQQMAQQYQQQQQLQAMQNEAHQQVQMQMMRDNARNQAEMQAMGVV